MDLDTFLGILREKGLRASTSLPTELSEQTDCAHMGIQSGFIEAKPLASLVLVYGVDLAQRGATAHIGPVVKYSQREYALTSAEHLQMATAQHYRTHTGSAKGVRDEKEAVYVESLQSYFQKWNPGALALLEPGHAVATADSRTVNLEIVPSGSATYRVDGQ